MKRNFSLSSAPNFHFVVNVNGKEINQELLCNNPSNLLYTLSNDTDSDQWLDAQEFQYWKGKGLSDTDAAKNCKTPDVDSDSITDYQEVFGYTVKIITGWDKDNTPISKEKTMYGDPQLPYAQGKDSQGNIIWTDTDGDGIPDIVETYFSNISYIDRQEKWDETKQIYQWLANYQWCRDYYLELNATAKDMSKPESEREDARSKAENWTQKAFNPFVVYNMPPTIAKWSASVREYHTSSGTIYTIQTEFVVRDIGGIKEVNQKIVELMTGKVVAEHTYIPEARYTEITAGWEFTVDYWTLKTQGYRAVGETTNYAGYSVEASKEIKGLIAIAIDALQALWQMLAGGLQEVWEAVEKAVTTLRAWVMEKLEYLLGLWASGFVQTIKTLPEEVLGINISAFLSLDLTKVTVDQILLFIGELLFVLLTARMYSDLLIGILLLFSPFYLSLMISPEDVYVNIDNKMKEQVAIEYPNFEKTLHKLELWDILFGFILPFLLLSGIKYLMIGFYEKNPVLIVGAAIVVIISLVGLAIILIKLKDP
ncbi:MAG: hypothetical protein QXU48_02205 [Thermoplasmata archaeon]